jgi:hypothetical protein
LSAAAAELLGRRGDGGRREEPPRDESGFRAHGSNQRFHRLQRHAVARAQTTAPSLAGVSPPARRILTLHRWRRKGRAGRCRVMIRAWVRGGSSDGRAGRTNSIIAGLNLPGSSTTARGRSARTRRTSSMAPSVRRSKPLCSPAEPSDPCDQGRRTPASAARGASSMRFRRETSVHIAFSGGCNDRVSNRSARLG